MPPFSVKGRKTKADVTVTLLYGYVTWNISAKQFARFRSVHHEVLLRVIGFQRRHRVTYTILSFPKALQKKGCESSEAEFRKRRGRRSASTQVVITQSGHDCDSYRCGRPWPVNRRLVTGPLPFLNSPGDTTHREVDCINVVVGVYRSDHGVDRCSTEGRQELPWGPFAT